MRPQRRKKAQFPFLGTALAGVMCALLGWWTVDPELPQRALKVLGIENLEVSLMGSVGALESSKKSVPKAAPALKGESKTKETKSADTNKVSQGDLPEHLLRLKERSDELDLREQELNQLEEELNKQRAELEERIKKLETVREQIATTLRDRIEVDQDRVSKLVETYSGMKPKQAAEILASLDEDLAVEILGKMKKKSAAEILNLIEPQKARSLSEKYAGYR